MPMQPARRNFLRGKFSQQDMSAMHPPGAEARFVDLCTACGDCAAACPEAIIVQTDGTLPLVDFARGACTFCGACAEACGTGALVSERMADWAWRADVQSGCLSFQGIACRTCEDVCEPRAIRFRLMTGGRSVPLLDQSQCTGCGACAFTCPAQAIRFERVTPAELERAV